MRMAREWDADFWAAQHALDPERNAHADSRLYWVWNEKSELLKRTADENPFGTEYFAWIDIGYFRYDGYAGQTLLQHASAMLPRGRVTMLDVSVQVWPVGEDQYAGGGFIGGDARGMGPSENNDIFVPIKKSSQVKSLVYPS